MTKKEINFYKKISPKLSEVLKLKNDDEFYKNYLDKTLKDIPKSHG